jgi:hypothetical protein
MPQRRGAFLGSWVLRCGGVQLTFLRSTRHGRHCRRWRGERGAWKMMKDDSIVLHEFEIFYFGDAHNPLGREGGGTRSSSFGFFS